MVVYYTTVFFMANLVDVNDKYNFSKVTRYIKREMFKKKKIILPINLHNNHWAISVIEIEMKIIKYLDSKHLDGDLYVKALLRFVHDAWNMLNKDPTLPDSDQWEMISRNVNIPAQANDYDCGVFCCMYADYKSNDVVLIFSNENIPQQRWVIKEAFKTTNYINID